jgi:hypothetical protein
MCASDDYDGPKIDLKVTLPIVPDFSVRLRLGPAYFMRRLHSEYKFVVWTFDTCSPRSCVSLHLAFQVTTAHHTSVDYALTFGGL